MRQNILINNNICGNACNYFKLKDNIATVAKDV